MEYIIISSIFFLTVCFIVYQYTENSKAYYKALAEKEKEKEKDF